MPLVDIDWDDMTRNPCRKRDLTWSAYSPVLGHEQRTTTGDTFDSAEESAATSVLGMRRHLNRCRHPRELSSLRDHGIIRTQCELQNRHCGAENAILHRILLLQNGTATRAV